MITKSIINAFIRRVILIDKRHVVIVVAANKDTTMAELKANRKEIANRPVLLEGDVEVDRPFKLEHLHYKVVLC